MLIPFALLPCLFGPFLCDLAVAQCSSFVKHLEYITSMCIVAMLECSSLVSCCILDGIVLLIAELCHYCFSCHLQTVHPIPVIFILISTKINSSFQSQLVCQVEAWLNLSFPKHAYALHITSRISCHVLHHVACALHRVWLLFPLLVFLRWVEPGDDYVIKEPVEYAYEDQAFINSENFAGKMTIPSKSLPSLLA